MTEAKHTELPWYAVATGVSDESLMQICVDDDRFSQHIGYVTKNRYVNGSVRANAEFIARACNSHYALVEALEELLSESSTFAREQAKRKARATLKQAKGES